MLDPQIQKEFDRQVQNILEKNYPQIAGINEKEFLKLLEPLKDKLQNIKPGKNTIPFVIVVKNELISAEDVMQLVEIKGKKGSVNMTPLGSKDFQNIDILTIPEEKMYLLVDIKTGKNTLNITPFEAMKIITDEKRLPITIDEGVALVTHFPEVLVDKENFNCFSMLGSRRNDQRVPAMWISYGKPRLGWCWEKNPHTWLGSASCKMRL